MKFILGKKIKMSQVFEEDGTVTPVTVLSAEPMKVTRLKSKEKDGYEAVQVETKISTRKAKKKEFRGQAEFKIRVLGDKDSRQKFTARLNYRPSNISSDFSNSAEFSSTVISVPLVLSFILPERIVSGQTMNFSLRYLNTSDANFEGAQLKIEYPDGFIFDNSLPSPSDGQAQLGDGNNTWNLPEIGSREEGNIVIKGTISGNEGDSKTFKAQIGTPTNNGDFVIYSQALSSPQISASPLLVEQSLLNLPDNNANSGQILDYRIKYRNTTSAAIGPVFITVKIDGKVVDASSVNAVNGFFSSSDNLITWNSSSLPALEQLEAGTEGTLDFSLKVKDNLPVNSFSDKNFTIVTTAKIDSFNVMRRKGLPKSYCSP